MVARVHGIDFSGDETMWRPGCQRSNVWIATAELRTDRVELIALRPVQSLPETSHPFDRLAAFLAGDNHHAAAIDAPFALPSRHMPVGGFPVLLRDVARLETGRRPFAVGEKLVESFPAGQLRQWKLPYEGYNGQKGRATRSTILEAIAPRIQIPGPWYSDCQENADALDSVLCVFAAIAATDNMAPIEDPAAAEHEGWIAVHPG